MLFLNTNRIICPDKMFQSNILITNETPARACLADFGLSTLNPSTQANITTITSGGTPSYMAPELLSPKKFGFTSAQPTKPADIYAFGMVIYEVLTGFRPFYDKNWQIFEIMLHVLNGGRPTEPEDVEKVGLGDGTWKLVEECWTQKPQERPAVEKVFTHLKRVAESSTEVGPTPDVARKLPEFESSGLCLFFFWPATILTLAWKVQ